MEKKFWAHSSAEVSPEAKIGSGTKIWQNSQVLGGAEIGENCMVGHNCFVGGKVKMGNGVKLESNIDAWDLVTLEDYVFVGPSAVFTNDPNPRAKFPKKKYPEYGKWKSTLVKEGASIGANATIVCGATIGKSAFIGAGSVVTKDIPDYGLAYGVPAAVHDWVCDCGNKLQFKKNKTVCKICGKKYLKEKKKVKQI